MIYTSEFNVSESLLSRERSSEASNLRRTWLKRFGLLREETNKYLSLFRNLAYWIDPASAPWLTGDGEMENLFGARADGSIINRRASEAWENLRAGMSSGITPETAPFWHLEMFEKPLNQRRDVQVWLDDVVELLRTDQLRSNNHIVWQQGHGSSALHGTGCESSIENEDTGIRMRYHPVGSWHASNGEDGRVNTLYEDTQLTVEQVVNMFGYDHVSDRTKHLWNSGAINTRIKVVHVTEPNDDRINGNATWRGKPFRGGWFELADDAVGLLKVEGWHELPFFVHRWDVRGSQVFGSGPCERILGDTKELQALETDLSELVAWMGRPAIAEPVDLGIGKRQGNRLRPGDRIVVSAAAQQQAYAIYQPRGEQIQAVLAAIERKEARISRGLYEDVFFAILQMKDMSGRTATEVAEKRQDALAKLAPMVSSQHWERLGPQIDRHFNIRLRQGALPKPPEIILGRPIKVVYTSTIAQAMKAAQLRNMDHLLMASMNLAQIDPGAAYKIDGAAFIDAYREGLDADPDLVRSTDEARAMEQRAQQAQQQAAMAAASKDAAQAARSASDTQTESGTMLDRIINQGAEQ